MKRLALTATFLAVAVAARAGSLGKHVVGRVTSACVLIQAVQGNKGQSGSGFFVGRNEVVTNYHVVKGAIEDGARLAVVIDSGKKSRKLADATIVGADKDLDLALLRTEHKASTTLRFLRESALRVTEAVWVAGYPFGTQPGLELTLTAGTITSLRRDEEGALRQVQVDAAINQGNSGGPVVNAQGKVVGVTRAVISPKVGAGMAIAIPCGAAEEFVKQARKFRRRAKPLRIIGRASRRELRVLRAEKVLEPWGTSVEITVRGGRNADEAMPFVVELTDRRREVLQREVVLVEDLEPRQQKTISIRLPRIDFADVAACRIAD